MHSLVPKTLITTYLEMTAPEQFQASYIESDVMRIEALTSVDVGFYLFLYQSVGENLTWRDRIIMPKDELKAAISHPNTAIFVLYVGGAPAGYVELSKEGESVEISYFGLREDYHGRGFGKHLLSYGIQQAWDMGAKRLWVHTCNLDGQFALANYEKRGFRVYNLIEEPMPERYRS
jgi:ribosomal protein S18 acetylase RimI-like enzyme